MPSSQPKKEFDNFTYFRWGRAGPGLAAHHPPRGQCAQSSVITKCLHIAHCTSLSFLPFLSCLFFHLSLSLADPSRQLLTIGETLRFSILSDANFAIRARLFVFLIICYRGLYSRSSELVKFLVCLSVWRVSFMSSCLGNAKEKCMSSFVDSGEFCWDGDGTSEDFRAAAAE